MKSVTKRTTIEDYYKRQDKIQSLEITKVFLQANIDRNRTNPAMIAEFKQKLDEVEKEISKLIAEI